MYTNNTSVHKCIVSESNTGIIANDTKIDNHNENQDNKSNESLRQFINAKRKSTEAETMANRNLKQRKVRDDSEIKTNNRFQVLENLQEKMDEDVNETEEFQPTKIISTSNNSNKPIKETKPPPIVIHGTINNHNAFLGRMKNLIKGTFHLKYHKNYTEIFTSNYEDFDILKRQYETTNIEFHTYTDKRKKKYTFVVKGLHDNEETTQILNELKEYKLNAVNINKMKNTAQPSFMVTFEEYITLNTLKKEVRHLNYTKVTWDNYINKRQITQCHRCQEWGHATTNCYAKPRCLKCAASHLTKDCQKTRDTPAKCANCQGDHPANATICSDYQRRVRLLENKNQVYKDTAKYEGLQTRKKLANLYNVNDYPKEFPPLQNITRGNIFRNPWTTADHTQAMKEREKSEPKRQVLPTNNGPIISSSESVTQHLNLSELQSLMSEMNKIKQICNIGKMLRAVKELRIQLEQCTTEMEQFEVFLTFTEQFNNK